MATTTYGSTPGVEVTVRGVAITGVIVGREQKLVIFGRGDTAAGTASSDTPTKVRGQADAEDSFGTDSELTAGLKDAIANGANATDGLLYGVAPSETQVTAEQVSQSDTLANAPITEDFANISVSDTGGTNPSPQFAYESPPPTPSTGDTVNINPLTGEVEFDAAADAQYEIDYVWLDWDAAFDAADGVLNEIETGIYASMSEAESVTSSLVTKVDTLRDPAYKLVRGLAPAPLNATADGTEPNLENGDAKYDVSSYSDNIDDDSMFLVAPGRKEDTDHSLIGAAAGLFAGHELTDPVYRDQLSGVEPEQRLGKADRDDLRDNHQVIAISIEGVPRLHSNTSTSTETDWQRDFHRRRIVDQTILVAKQVGDAVMGDLNTDDTQLIAQEEVAAQIEGFVADGLLEPNRSDEQNWYVTTSEPSADTLAIELGITPEGVVKTVTADISVEA